ncbi:unnamed protein product [Vitrella brassicaformis CCMP3155]|uniref:Uncharacterized protein n=1 Tax=Vitrella brassicaformis (strain CCMP3155) TaxID=1169540 RepID=A0A0G4ETV3_VITBC|nr:unnamed protein product [Vitrella brassicaformis CCMP3155]|eukprot:CEM02057.1 unnamed protein product [Vitrella brassicaformis CCMP3155]
MGFFASDSAEWRQITPRHSTFIAVEDSRDQLFDLRPPMREGHDARAIDKHSQQPAVPSPSRESQPGALKPTRDLDVQDANDEGIVSELVSESLSDPWQDAAATDAPPTGEQQVPASSNVDSLIPNSLSSLACEDEPTTVPLTRAARQRDKSWTARTCAWLGKRVSFRSRQGEIKLKEVTEWDDEENGFVVIEKSEVFPPATLPASPQPYNTTRQADQSSLHEPTLIERYQSWIEES